MLQVSQILKQLQRYFFLINTNSMCYFCIYMIRVYITTYEVTRHCNIPIVTHTSLDKL